MGTISGRLLSIKWRQVLLPSLYRPDFRHSLGLPYPSAPRDKPDLLRPMDVTVNQIKALRENDEVCKFAYGHRAEGFFKTKSRCCIGSCGTNNLNDNNFEIGTAARTKKIPRNCSALQPWQTPFLDDTSDPVGTPRVLQCEQTVRYEPIWQPSTKR